MKIWISRWALSRGIEEREVHPREIEGSVFQYVWGHLLHRGDWHQTRLEALQVALDMAVSKEQYFEKEVAKTKQLIFDFKKEIERESASDGKQG